MKQLETLDMGNHFSEIYTLVQMYIEYIQILNAVCMHHNHNNHQRSLFSQERRRVV